MLVINNDRPIPFDVDGTLMVPFDDCSGPSISFVDPYDGGEVVRCVHMPHRKLLLNYIARGAQVIVWSKNGFAWAQAAVLAMGIDHPSLIVMTKPLLHVDDEPAANWMGERVFIPADNSFGQDRKLK